MLENCTDDSGLYALITLGGKEQAVWFAKNNDEKYGVWFEPSPCQLQKLIEIKRDIDEFLMMWTTQTQTLPDGTNAKEYIDAFVKPNVYDGWLYRILKNQYTSYIPDEVENIKIISERECLEYLLRNTYRATV